MVRRLTNGLTGLAKQRKVEVVRGVGKFSGAEYHRSHRTGWHAPADAFDKCIIAAGSEPVKLPFIPRGSAHHRFHRCAGAAAACPKRLLVIGGGIIGLEMACVYDALGSKVSVVELTDAADARRRSRPGAAAGEAPQGALRTDPAGHEGHEGRGAAGRHPRHLRCRRQDHREIHYDRVLVAVGRVPNGTADQCGRRRRHRQRSWLHSRRQPDAHQRAATSLPSATSSASPCWRTRPRTRPRWPPKSQPATRPPSMRA